jgi:hypothetical protein
MISGAPVMGGLVVVDAGPAPFPRHAAGPAAGSRTGRPLLPRAAPG